VQRKPVCLNPLITGGTSIDGSKSEGTQSTRSHRSRSSQISRISSSQPTDRSSLTVAPAHSRIDGLAARIKAIQKLLVHHVTNSAVSVSASVLIPEPQSPPAIEACLQLVAFTAFPALLPESSDVMNGVQLFSSRASKIVLQLLSPALLPNAPITNAAKTVGHHHHPLRVKSNTLILSSQKTPAIQVTLGDRADKC
jgi:hypothetical protein